LIEHGVEGDKKFSGVRDTYFFGGLAFVLEALSEGVKGGIFRAMAGWQEEHGAHGTPAAPDSSLSTQTS
jgi:hypothetical protein